MLDNLAGYGRFPPGPVIGTGGVRDGLLSQETLTYDKVSAIVETLLPKCTPNSSPNKFWPCTKKFPHFSSFPTMYDTMGPIVSYIVWVIHSMGPKLTEVT